jgi:hypothetical protein
MRYRRPADFYVRLWGFIMSEIVLHQFFSVRLAIVDFIEHVR